MPSATAALVALMASSSASFFALHLGFGWRADANDSDAARKLREPLLEFFLIVVARRLLDLAADLLNAAVDLGAGALAADDRRVVLVHDDTLCAAKLILADVLELQPDLLGDDHAACKDGHVLEHRLAAVAEARRLDSAALERARGSG